MTMNLSLTLEVAKWVASSPHVAHPQETLYPFAVIADAFDKGRDHKEKELREKFIEAHLNRVNAFTQHVVKVLNFLEEYKYDGKLLFINPDKEMPRAIITVAPEHHDTAEFIDAVYKMVAATELESQSEGKPIDISFLSHTEDLDKSLLKDDGYDLQLDLATGKPIE